MKLDYSEFIARHHKPAAALPPAKPRARDHVIFVGSLILALYAGIFLYIAVFSAADDTTRLIALMAFMFALVIGVAGHLVLRRQAMRDAEATLLREVLEGSRGARLITDGADQPVYYNQKFERLCRGAGKPGLQALTRLFQNNAEGAAHFRLLADQAHRGLTDSIELLSQFDDRERWLMITAQPVAGFAGYVHWRVDDVTQKHTVDRAIREEREKLIDFTDNAPVGFFSVDEKGRFVFANATFARWLGEDLRTLLEQGTLHTYLIEPPQHASPYDVVADSRARQVVEVRMKGTGGRPFLASINQVVVHEPDGRVRTRAVVHDLTAEREIRTALKVSEDRFQRFFEEAPVGIIQIGPDGVIADCNHAFSSIMGIPVQDLEGRRFTDLIHDDDRLSVQEALHRMVREQTISAPIEISLKGKKSSIITQMFARKFRDDDNIVLHFIDMTQQKTLEVQFVQSQKMQAIGQLAGGVAHDFNNLLTAIIGFCDLLFLRHKPGDPSFADIMQIKQNSNRAANLVRQLLAFSRQQTLRPRVQDITDILTEVSHLLRRLIGASIDLELVHGLELGLVKVDEGQMEQVLINLAVNARDAMNGSGKLTIVTENFTNRAPLELISEVLPQGHWTLITVSDTGCGIPEDNLARIFEPFFTTKEVGHGTGLGLATVYGIIRQTGGFLDVKSTVGSGTTFFIFLPRAQETEAEEKPDLGAEDDPSKDLTGTERILLVEDEDAVRTFSQRALANKGYSVLTAESGEAALNVLSQESKPIDLLVTDVVMPGMDGPALAAAARKDNPDLKIIFVSGYTEDKLKDHMTPNTWFLPKPFTLKQLAAKVKEVLEQ